MPAQPIPHYVIDWDAPRALDPSHPVDRELLRVPACDRPAVTLAATRYLNSTPDAGRPSDAYRAVVAEYLRDPSSFLARA